MTSRFWPALFSAYALVCALHGEPSSKPFDAAPFGTSIEDGRGIMWDDPREIHAVTVEFADKISDGVKVHVEYWGSHWPAQHLPKDREPGGGDVGWLELGNWYNGGWRVADAERTISGNSLRFNFRPVNAKEFPDLTNYASTGRFTLKIRVTSEQPMPKITKIETFTDSTYSNHRLRVVWAAPCGEVYANAFNGWVSANSDAVTTTVLSIAAVNNSDPNTFDRTLVTLHNGTNTFTFKVDDLEDGALFLPEYGAAILPADDHRDYATVAKLIQRAGHKTLYDRIAEMPEQTWTSAWNGMPPKKSRICFVLGLDGARQKFRLDADGDVFIRWNDQFMKGLPARDTARLDLEKPPVHFKFELPAQPVERHIEEESIPTCITTWERDGVRITQTAFATALDGTKPKGGPPPPDVFAVAMLRFDFTNFTDTETEAALPFTIRGGETYEHLRIDAKGLIWNGDQLRGQIIASGTPTVSSNHISLSMPLAPHRTETVFIKMPYLPLTEPMEFKALEALDFDRERKATGDYWRAQIDRSSRLITPEPILNNFYRAVPGHLLINSEFDPGSDRRFARVGSFNYGNYGNESCMMVLDLDRRGYHKEAEECLDAWLHYQGTVGLPGDFDSKEGVLYGTAGYESGGYNQHHGWILWTLAEHYRFTRDEAWLRQASPGIRAGADWIIRETARNDKLDDGRRGLLPPGDLEDIGDWWTWLSTSCYTWRGLDGAAWALEQIHDPDAPRIRAAAEEFHKNLVDHFMAASARSPVVRLRDGTAIPQIPSYVQRRGRSFGWICETLEGAIHLIITKAIDPKSTQAQWILKDYEDNLFLSNQYGYTLDNFDKYWFGRGGMSMQACLLFDVEAYLYRDDVKQALRAMFNAIALNHFSDVHMNTEHALPEMGDWRGDHYKTSDEANACGWLREIFVREEGDSLLIGQAVPRDWLKPGQECGIENAATYFGKTTVVYHGGADRITAELQGPTRNPPHEIRLRFRAPNEKAPLKVAVNGKPWKNLSDNWVILPGDIGTAEIVATY
ncbi:MAG TPA: hypothetical protein VGO67_11695 [Verrucomicrobiae bacterium]